MSTAKIAEALAAFQAAMPTVHKGKTAKAGSYSYSYADLADLCEVAMPLLSKQGLSFTCGPQRAESGYELVGTLLHTSGESLSGSLPIMGRTAQEIGSSITYNRRYLLGALTGLVTDDDDDGQLAQAAKKAAPRKRAQSAPRQDTGEAISDRQVTAIKATLRERGIEDRDQQLAGIARVIGREVSSTKDLTRAEGSKVLDSLKPKAQPETGYAPPPSDDDAPPVEGWDRWRSTEATPSSPPSPSPLSSPASPPSPPHRSRP